MTDQSVNLIYYFVYIIQYAIEIEFKNIFTKHF